MGLPIAMTAATIALIVTTLGRSFSARGSSFSRASAFFRSLRSAIAARRSAVVARRSAPRAFRFWRCARLRSRSDTEHLSDRLLGVASGGGRVCRGKGVSQDARRFLWVVGVADRADD